MTKIDKIDPTHNFTEVDHLERAKMDKPVDVEALIQKIGISFSFEPMPEGKSGLIRKELNGRFTIKINSNEGRQRQRFTAAHELGHYFMHRHLLEAGGEHADRLFDGEINPSGPLTYLHETQANRFAAETLMPKSEIKRLFDPLTLNYEELSAAFEVSPKAMAWRIYNLGLADKQQLDLP